MKIASSLGRKSNRSWIQVYISSSIVIWYGSIIEGLIGRIVDIEDCEIRDGHVIVDEGTGHVIGPKEGIVILLHHVLGIGPTDSGIISGSVVSEGKGLKSVGDGWICRLRGLGLGNWSCLTHVARNY